MPQMSALLWVLLFVWFSFFFFFFFLINYYKSGTRDCLSSGDAGCLCGTVFYW